jgi:hypothetical protein
MNRRTMVTFGRVGYHLHARDGLPDFLENKTRKYPRSRVRTTWRRKALSLGGFGNYAKDAPRQAPIQL